MDWIDFDTAGAGGGGGVIYAGDMATMDGFDSAASTSTSSSSKFGPNRQLTKKRPEDHCKTPSANKKTNKENMKIQQQMQQCKINNNSSNDDFINPNMPNETEIRKNFIDRLNGTRHISKKHQGKPRGSPKSESNNSDVTTKPGKSTDLDVAKESGGCTEDPVSYKVQVDGDVGDDVVSGVVMLFWVVVVVLLLLVVWLWR